VATLELLSAPAGARIVAPGPAYRGRGEVDEPVLVFGKDFAKSMWILEAKPI
jgi:hypothetical protein